MGTVRRKKRGSRAQTFHIGPEMIKKFKGKCEIPSFRARNWNKVCVAVTHTHTHEEEKADFVLLPNERFHIWLAQHQCSMTCNQAFPPSSFRPSSTTTTSYPHPSFQVGQLSLAPPRNYLCVGATPPPNLSISNKSYPWANEAQCQASTPSNSLRVTATLSLLNK